MIEMQVWLLMLVILMFYLLGFITAVLIISSLEVKKIIKTIGSIEDMGERIQKLEGRKTNGAIQEKGN
jgi:hypothetical protein